MSRGCVAQADIRTFYDALPVLAIIDRLRSEGFDDAELSALIRHQMCVQILVSWSAAHTPSLPIPNRSCGGLTGSRCAGFLGRCPLELIARERSCQWKPWSFAMGGHVAALAVWVDNCYAFSNTVHGATSILNDLEEQLLGHWHLSFKDGSKSVICAKGGDVGEGSTDEDDEDDDTTWPRTDAFNCLGHVLTPTGSVAQCFYATKRLCWNAYFLNFSNKMARRIPISHKLALLKRAILPIIAYRCTRWPFQQKFAKELDMLQNKMVAVMTREPRYPEEELASYLRRRNQMASRLASKLGRWSHVWARRVVAWHDHLNRLRNAHTLVARVFHWHGAAWLRERRLEHGSIATAGRTRTRLPFSMPVHQRWEEGVAVAEALVPDAAACDKDVY